MTTIGILHPGQMGIALAQSALIAGNRVLWASEGRSAASKTRAQILEDARTIDNLCRQSDIVISVCPPEYAEDLADEVRATQFAGVFVDANAISPERARRIAARMPTFVDGGIIGLPSLDPGETWLHVSGVRAQEIAQAFGGGPVTIDVMGEEPGQASALKMCYAAYNKGAIALAGAVSAAAHRLGVFSNLAEQWDRKGPGTKSVETRLLRAAPKAWRWVGEMHEIADTLRAAGLPAEFHVGAAEIYERLREMKDQDQVAFQEIMHRLNRG